MLNFPCIKKPPISAVFQRGSYNLKLRAGVLDGIADIELLEVLDEQTGQAFGGFVVGVLVFPGVAWVEQVGFNARYQLRHAQVDDRQQLGFGTDQRAALDRCDHATGGRDVEALAHAVATAGPAGVDQIDFGVETTDTLDQQLSVLASRTREERRAEAGGEGRLDAAAAAHFGGTDQRGVTGEEVISRLLFVEDRHRRQYASQVAGEEDHCVRLAAEVLLAALLDQLQRVSRAAVLGQAVVGVVRYAVLIEHHVFQHGAKLDGFPDHRLVLLGQVDALGIATAFDVEHHAHAPAVLVVADQVAAFVSRQGGLAGAGQTEEQGHVAFFTAVGRAVHRQHVGVRQQEVLHSEHGFLHFTGVAHAGDQDFLGGKVEDHAAIGVGAVTLRYALEVGDVEHLPLVFVSRVVLLRVDKQATAEQVLPGSGGGHLDWQVVRVGRTYMNVGQEAVLRVGERLYAVPQGIELVSRERTVDCTPVDFRLGTRLLHDEAISRRTTSAMACAYDQRAVGGQLAFTATKSFFDQLGSADVGVHGVVGLRHVGPRRPRGRVFRTFCSRNLINNTAKKVRRIMPKKASCGCSL